MADRRQQLRERAGEIKQSVAGTFGEAKARAKRAASAARDKIEPDETITDQRAARADRARIEAQQAAQVEARQEALQEIRDEFQDARETRIRAELKTQAQDDILREELRAQRAQAELARAEARREAFVDEAEQRVDQLETRADRQTRRQAAPPVEQRQQPASTFEPMFGAPPAIEGEQREQQPAPADNMGPFGGGVFGPPPEDDRQQQSQQQQRTPFGPFDDRMF